MKTEATTPDGYYLVKVSQEEHQTLYALQEAVKGREWGEIMSRNPVLGDDLTAALRAVQEWCENAIALNMMQDAIDKVRATLGLSDGSKDATG